jgi:hypothetical protein
MQTSLTTAVADLVTAVNAGVDFNNKADRTCRAKLLKAAATDCAALLKAESKFVKSLSKDFGGAKRDAAKSKATTKFTTDWGAANCTTTATAAGIAGMLTALSDSIVADTTVSPNVADTWTMITPPTEVKYNGKTLAPICSLSTPYVYFVKRGTVNKLLVYYQGGGACWDYLTCGPFPQNKQAAGASDNPALASSGLADFTNPANPFRDWNLVFVPYCTGDVHWGTAAFTYQDASSSNSVTIQHKGWINAQVVEKWTREHFVNPSEVFVTGSSAGAYGALLNSVYFEQNVYQASQFYVFPDAGNGVITQQFLENNIRNWGIEASLPKWIKEFNQPLETLSLDKVTAAAANFYPHSKIGHYTTAWDYNQTQFYNVMVYPADVSKWLTWWLSSCDWNRKMHEQAVASAAAAANYRYYIGAGSRHTVWGHNKIFTDTTGGVPLLIDWIDAMLTGDAAWTNVECTNCNLLTGDPQPNPLVAPFEANGVVSCP